MGFKELIEDGLEFLLACFSANVLTGIIPAFFIASAIVVFVSRGAVLRYLGPEAKKTLSYGVAAVSGVILTV